jgi:hypothetical protein
VRGKILYAGSKTLNVLRYVPANPRQFAHGVNFTKIFSKPSKCWFAMKSEKFNQIG